MNALLNERSPMLRKMLAFAFATIALTLALPTLACADSASASNLYYYGQSMSCKHDKGFSNPSGIEEGDPHFGWRLGKFVVSGFTSRTQDDMPVFLKNAGDQVKLSFVLEQDIDKLNGQENYYINTDENGYDQYFGIPKTNFGRGMLIVRHTDYQNDTPEPVKYSDYLKGKKVGAETDIDLFEEGDYEVALDYETRKPGFLSVIPEYRDYKILFKFKVRNSNTMLFLFDTETGDELYNGSVTPNGFRIDTANSHYLEINVKREVLNETRDGLVEDTRFNRSATSGSEYVDAGIYTVTARNPTTGDEPTTKVIYVGDDDLLKASVANGISVTEVQERIDAGATVADDGTLVQADAQIPDETGEDAGDMDASELPGHKDPNESFFSVRPIFIVLLAMAIVVAALRMRKGGAKK